MTRTRAPHCPHPCPHPKTESQTPVKTLPSLILRTWSVKMKLTLKEFLKGEGNNIVDSRSSFTWTKTLICFGVTVSTQNSTPVSLQNLGQRGPEGSLGLKLQKIWSICQHGTIALLFPFYILRNFIDTQAQNYRFLSPKMMIVHRDFSSGYHWDKQCLHFVTCEKIVHVLNNDTKTVGC